jgi:chromosomal replication initiator protein
VGKTHLLQGVVEMRARLTAGSTSGPAGRQKVRYVTGEEFTNEYITAVRGGKIDTFRAKMRQLDMLAIDDIHFLSNKTATQNEFLHTLDAIGLGGASILLASDEHPRQIGRFSASLTSRFLSGMVVRIERPEMPMRQELVRRMAADRDLELSDAATRLLATRFTGSVRELSGALMKLAALRRLDGSRSNAVGAIMVEQMLEGEIAPGPRTPIRLAEIIDSVCSKLGIEPDELLGRGRHRRVVLARGLVVHLARELTTLSFPEIARGLGRENHSTVHTAARRITREIKANSEEVESGSRAPTFSLPGIPEISLRELVEQLKYDVMRRCTRR